ncbi:MAG: FtsX-like permease family protein [Gemmatimonadota bacterium]|nr:FtsX-like permease family protein [Gemmatimonadota bacterium]
MSFPVRMARREWRSTVRRLGVYMTSITVGVGALVALHSFRNDVVRSIETRSRTLLGSDARLSANRELPDSLTPLLDSLASLGAVQSRVTGLLSMALAEESGLTRLVQVRGVEGGFPFYGDVRTQPPGLWGDWQEGDVLVDPAVFVQLDVDVGDTIRLGGARFHVAGSVEGLPTDVGLQASAGPRVFVPRASLDDTGLLVFGSLARHHVYLQLPGDIDADEVEEAHEELLRATQVSFRTPEEQARSLTRSTDFMADYLGLVGLAALLLGGVGVGSAVNVYVRGKLTAVAVLRCLGATQQQVFSTYLLQAVWMGGFGSLVGVILGLVTQRFLPLLIRDVYPVPVDASISAGPVLFGLFLGTWVAFVFALLPLLEVRRVSPLQALRQGEGSAGTPGRSRSFVLALIAATVLGLTLYEAPSPTEGLVFALGLAVIAGILWGFARLLAWSLRRFFPRRAPYTVRQGVANLFRPQNQTVAVTLALGFGVLVVSVIIQLQRNISRELSAERGPEGANLLLFDVQPEQEDRVVDLLAEFDAGTPQVTPMVPGRITALDGIPVADLIADSTNEEGPSRWALRREYRNTYRSDLKASETLMAGVWWDDGPGDSGDGGLARISLEEDLADDLAVQLGSRITWTMGGIEVESVVTNLRVVDWARFDTNFFVVFEPGVIEDMPRTSMVLAGIEDENTRARFQQQLVRTLPNVSVLDLATIQSTIEDILGQILTAIRILAGLCAGAGLIVMAGSIASTRAQRRREGALLRTIGARIKQVRRILVSEYAALGTMAALAGSLLSLVAAWLITVNVFEFDFVPALGPAAALWATTVALTLATGFFSGRSADKGTPLAVLRETAD